jgi:hypothetical protein
VSSEVDLIRAFRAENAVVDPESQDAARAALLAHIATRAPEKRRARSRGSGRRLVAVRVGGDIVAIVLSVLVVLVVAAVILSVGSQRHTPPPAGHHGPRTSGPPVIRNYSPRTPPPLPGEPHTADLAKPGAIPGLSGSPTGIFTTSASVVNGVNTFPFTITASGLAPTHGQLYAVWLLPAVRTWSSGYVLVKPTRPRLLGVIRPGVGHDGELAAEGLEPADLAGSSELVLLTLQRGRSVARPGRTVLEGFM